MARIPMQLIVAQMAGVPPEEILKWKKQDWLNFADELDAAHEEETEKTATP